MSIFESIFLGVIQGLTEWLPVSSSGHLVLFSKWFNIAEASLEFDIWLHLASLLVIVVFFKEEIKQTVFDFFAPKTAKAARRNWLWYILISTVITAIIGYLVYDKIVYFRTTDMVANFLVVTSVLLLATKFVKNNKGSLSWRVAVLLGFVQGLAVIPGLSRSGAVIALAFILGINKKDAFEYTFILAIPAILGSFVLALGDMTINMIHILGFIVTTIVGYLTLAWLKTIIKRDYLYLFFIYTLLLSLIIKIF